MERTKKMGDLIISAHKALKMNVERDLRPLGLGMGQLQILVVFNRSPERSFEQHEIVDILGVDKGNVSRSMGKLVEKGYLALDTRGHKSYRLTVEGLALRRHIDPLFQRIHEKMTRDLKAEDLLKAIATLETLVENLEASE